MIARSEGTSEGSTSEEQGSDHAQQPLNDWRCAGGCYATSSAGTILLDRAKRRPARVSV